MMVRKFYAETAREALRLVREKLGANALILSNRRTAAGVEILAVPEGEIDAVTLANAAVPPPPKAAAPKPVEPAPRPARLVPQPPPAPAPEPKVHTVSVAAQTAAPPNAAASYDLVQEVRFLRSMLEGQLAAFAWNDLQRGAPAKIEVLRQLLAAGFSAGFSRRNVDFVAPGLDSARALRLVKQRLQQQLRVTAAEQSPV